uniref:Putative secreted protein n=1 Tax=Anopheles triannulatus TaxID=58253 RepID=A0A2M4B6H5_9DIPT
MFCLLTFAPWHRCVAAAAFTKHGTHRRSGAPLSFVAGCVALSSTNLFRFWHAPYTGLGLKGDTILPQTGNQNRNTDCATFFALAYKRSSSSSSNSTNDKSSSSGSGTRATPVHHAAIVVWRGLACGQIQPF